MKQNIFIFKYINDDHKQNVQNKIKDINLKATKMNEIATKAEEAFGFEEKMLKLDKELNEKEDKTMIDIERNIAFLEVSGEMYDFACYHYQFDELQKQHKECVENTIDGIAQYTRFGFRDQVEFDDCMRFICGIVDGYSSEGYILQIPQDKKALLKSTVDEERGVAKFLISEEFLEGDAFYYMHY